MSVQRLATLTTVRLEPDAQILKACLEARGIRCTLTDGEVQVAPSDLEAAQDFLRSVEAQSQPRKERSPLAEWIAQVERSLRSVPLPLRIVLILFGSVWLAGTLGMFLANLLKYFK